MIYNLEMNDLYIIINLVLIIQIAPIIIGLTAYIIIWDIIDSRSTDKHRPSKKKNAALMISLFMIVDFLICSFVLFLYSSSSPQVTTSGAPTTTPQTYDKYIGLLAFAGLAAGGIFAGMLNLLTQKDWDIMENLFFLLATVLFIGFLTLAFRWWIVLIDAGTKILT